MTTGICHISDPGHFSVLSHNDRRPGHNNKPGHDLIQIKDPSQISNSVMI